MDQPMKNSATPARNSTNAYCLVGVNNEATKMKRAMMPTNMKNVPTRLRGAIL
jgi:hypothetical protein